MQNIPRYGRGMFFVKHFFHAKENFGVLRKKFVQFLLIPPIFSFSQICYIF